MHLELSSLTPAYGISAAVQFGKLMHLEITGIGPETKGVVTSTPAGINCGTTCAGWFLPGQKVSLTATPTDNLWRFRGWSDAGCALSTCEFVLDADKTVDAQFSNSHLWVRTFRYDTGFATSMASNGQVTVAGISEHAQDLGAGSVLPKPFSRANLFVARIGSDGVPAFTRVFGGSAAMHYPVVIRERADGGFSLMVGINAPNTGASSYSVDLGDYQAVLGPLEYALIWMDFDSSGELTGAGPLDTSLSSLTLVQSGATTFSNNRGTNDDTISRLGPDWSNVWSITNPNQRMILAAGPPDAVWVTANYVPVEMNCTGGPAANGALLRIDANGACTVAWPYPEGFNVNSMKSPGGAALMDVTYLHGFEFAGSMLPEPPTGLALHGRLRFDPAGNPEWSRPVPFGGGATGQQVSDAVTLDGGDLLLAGSYSGISEFSPTDPDPGAEFLATYSDQTGEIIWFNPFRQISDRTSYADFERLGRLPDGRVVLSGPIKGTFDFGGGPVWSPTDTNHFIALYQF